MKSGQKLLSLSGFSYVLFNTFFNSVSIKSSYLQNKEIKPQMYQNSYVASLPGMYAYWQLVKYGSERVLFILKFLLLEFKIKVEICSILCYIVRLLWLDTLYLKVSIMLIRSHFITLQGCIFEIFLHKILPLPLLVYMTGTVISTKLQGNLFS